MIEMICNVAECDKPGLARGLCSMHYNLVYRNGELTLLRPKRCIETFDRAPVSETDKAYFAGYFDGEGCVYLQRPPKRERNKPIARWPLRVDFKQTQESAILEMHRLYGGGLTLDRLEHLDGQATSQYNSKWRPYIKWMLAQTEAVLCFLRDIQPFLREKRAQVDLSIERFKPYFEYSEGQALYDELRALKKRQLCVDAVAQHVAQFGRRTITAHHQKEV